MPGAKQVPRDGASHVSQTNECNFHSVLPHIRIFTTQTQRHRANKKIQTSVSLRLLPFRFLARLAPVKPAPDDRLEKHVIGGPRHPDPEPEVDLPLRRDV